jgi:uncharacterized membrane protein YhaH (DUF805 family)
MSFAEAIREGLSKYATFDGRARRSEFWWFLLFFAAVASAASVLDVVLFGIDSHDPGVISGLTTIGMLIPSLAVNVRRLHDVDRSGWWLWLGVVPLLGTLLLTAWAVQDSHPANNRFGACPKPL